MAPRDLRLACSLLLLVSAACGEPSTHSQTPDASSDSGTQPDDDKGTDVVVTLDPSREAELKRLRQAVAEVANITDSELLEQHAVTTKTLTYDPSVATGMSLIQASPLALSKKELDVLKQRGLVISHGTAFPTFTYGYTNIYMADLPVYISADSILGAIHSSYDDILLAFERELLVPNLKALLSGMRAKLASASLSAEEKEDLDIFLGVAEALVSAAPGTGASAGATRAIQELVALANMANGTASHKLFGVAREVDFSQFTVRGHYKDDPVLEAYFRCMIWLGRTDFRLIETLGDGSQVFRRRQFDAMLAIRSLVDEPLLARYQTIERVVRSFVGESDNMVLEEVDPLLGSLKQMGKVEELSDAQIAQALIAGDYGTQEIASQLIINKSGEELPLSRTFMLFGQRYVIDSHVFSNVTWARTQAKRMMPDPLDVAFAALGNDSAAQLLASQLKTYAYAPNLKSTRILVDAHDSAFWGKNLYNAWLKALRTLSPKPGAEDNAGLPEIAQTEAWGRRVLNTQLASWAELRHDTILYAKQSYTDGAECEFPDAYVDPYPAFFAAIEDFAAYGKELSLLAEGTPAFAERIAAYFDKVAHVASLLRSMAEQQRIGEPFNAAQLAFINRAVATTTQGCAGVDSSEGWYADLFFHNASTVAYDPTIADVHTQPTDEGGAPVGRVLHVATGNPRLMVVTVDTCAGPRAYAGVAAAYHEKITENFQRLDDQAWSPLARDAADVPWMSDIVAR